MTIRFGDGEPVPVDVLAQTEEIYRETAEELTRAILDVRGGKFARIKDAAQAVKDLRAAFQLVQEERGRVDKLRKTVSGAVDGRALDFDAARSEIGRRLACLRDAGGH